METFGQLLTKARKRARFTQRELASRVGLSANHLNRIEKDQRRPPRRDKVLAIAEVLELDSQRTDHLLLAGGHAPIRTSPLIYESPLTLKDIETLQKDKKHQIDVPNHVINQLIKTFNNPKLTPDQKKEMERQVVSFLGWLRHSASKGRS